MFMDEFLNKTITPWFPNSHKSSHVNFFEMKESVDTAMSLYTERVPSNYFCKG